MTRVVRSFKITIQAQARVRYKQPLTCCFKYNIGRVDIIIQSDSIEIATHRTQNQTVTNQKHKFSPEVLRSRKFKNIAQMRYSNLN